MKPTQLDRSSPLNKSITIEYHYLRDYIKIWHYHIEYELVIQFNSNGTWFIGDSIGKFGPGQIMLIGKNLPHMWHSDEICFEEESGLMAKAIVIHFREDFTGEKFFTIPEMRSIYQLLERVKQGINFTEGTERITKKIKGLLELDDFDRVIEFLLILRVLSMEKNYRLISSLGFINSFDITENGKLDNIYAYLLKNFKDDIRLDEAAEIAHMTSSAFSRYFKKVNRKTFTRYVNEVRVGYAVNY